MSGDILCVQFWPPPTITTLHPPTNHSVFHHALEGALKPPSLQLTPTSANVSLSSGGQCESMAFVFSLAKLSNPHIVISDGHCMENFHMKSLFSCQNETRNRLEMFPCTCNWVEEQVQWRHLDWKCHFNWGECDPHFWQWTHNQTRTTKCLDEEFLMG